jgi:hypothetical protein
MIFKKALKINKGKGHPATKEATSYTSGWFKKIIKRVGLILRWEEKKNYAGRGKTLPTSIKEQLVN